MGQFELLVHRDGEGIFVEFGSPAVVIRFDGRELNWCGLGGSICFGDGNRFAGDAGDFLGSDQRGGGETPLSFGDHADAETEAVLIRDERDFIGDATSALRREAVSGELIAIAADADVGVSGALLLGFRDRHRAEFL